MYKRGTQPIEWATRLSNVCYQLNGLRVQEHVQWRQHQGNRAEQLNEDVQRWPSGILEGVADGIANHASLMRFALLTQDGTFRIKGINHLTSFVDAQVASFNVFLRIVPRATTIVQEKGEDDTAHSTDHQQTSLSLGAKDHANCDWR